MITLGTALAFAGAAVAAGFAGVGSAMGVGIAGQCSRLCRVPRAFTDC